MADRVDEGLRQIACVAISCCTIVSTPCLILLMCRQRLLHQKPARKFLLSLLLSDLLFASCLVLSGVVHMGLGKERGTSLEQPSAVLFALFTSLVLILLCLGLMTMDRLLAVRWPFLYQAKMTSRNVLLIILAAWLLAFTWLGVLIVVFYVRRSSVYGMVMMTFLILISSGLVLLVTSNVIVFTEVRKQIRKIIEVTVFESGAIGTQRKKMLKRKKEERAARLCLGLVFAFLILWTPFLVFVIDVCASEAPSEAWAFASLASIQLSGLVNPIIAVTVDAELRRALCKTWVGFSRVLKKSRTSS